MNRQRAERGAAVPGSGTGGTIHTIIAALRHTHGLDVACYDPAFLDKSFEKRRAITAATTPAAYLERLTHDRAEAEAFCHSLRISYSEFFRNPLSFALLEQQVVPLLITEKEHAAHAEIRVWSAGCATGQEAWSIAILLDDLTRAQDNPPAYRVFATDLSEPDLVVARAGVYSADAVGNVRARHLRDYFTRQGEAFAIAPRLRARVDFSVGDLLDERTTCPPASIYGNFDLVLCSNVLLYYRPDIRRQILDKICQSLGPGGYCVTGEAERDIVASHGGLRAVAPPATIFRK